MTSLQEAVQTQAQDMMAIAAGFARPHDEGHAMCGWRFSGARKRGAGLPYRFVPSLANSPSSMICERFMPTEEAVAAMVGLAGEEELSGDNE